MSEQDPAALIAEARGCADAYEDNERNYWTANDRAIFDAENADLLRRLAAALERAQADAARMREALEPFAKLADVKLIGEWRGDQSIQPTDLAYYVKFKHLRDARAALEPRHD